MTILKRLLVAAFFMMTAQSGLNATVPEIDEIYANIGRFIYVLQSVNGVDESWQAVATWLESTVSQRGYYGSELILIDVVISSDSSLDDKVAWLHKMKEQHEQDRQEEKEKSRQGNVRWMKEEEAKKLQTYRRGQIDYIKRLAITTVSVVSMLFLGIVGERLANRLMDAVLV